MFYARSASHGHDKEPISNHLHWVSTLAQEFASIWSGGEEAAFSGSMHDVGKYGDLFQDVLEHRATHVDHWTMGAYLAVKCRKEQGRAAYLAIEGHHEGLQRASMDSLLHRYKLFKETQLFPQWAAVVGQTRGFGKAVAGGRRRIWNCLSKRLCAKCRFPAGGHAGRAHAVLRPGGRRLPEFRGV